MMLRFSYRFILVVAFCLQGVVTAAAFEETKPRLEMNEKPAQNLLPPGEAVKKQLQIKQKQPIVKPSEDSGSTGFFFSIPGIDKLKMLPKLDFGLEVLHDDKQEKLATEPPDPDLAIKGSIRHKF